MFDLFLEDIDLLEAVELEISFDDDYSEREQGRTVDNRKLKRELDLAINAFKSKVHGNIKLFNIEAQKMSLIKGNIYRLKIGMYENLTEQDKEILKDIIEKTNDTIDKFQIYAQNGDIFIRKM